MSFIVSPFQKKVPKPWGYEIIYTKNDSEYTGKILYVKAGRKLSFQYHDAKTEVMTLYAGKARIWLEDDKGSIQKILMKMQAGYTVSIGQKHRVEAIEDSIILEVSDKEKGTTIRIDDDYKRPDETEAVRKSAHRGWNK